jgi:hypothetical protein
VEQPPAALGVEGAIGGRGLLVQGGHALSTYDPADPTAPYRTAPRSAVGLDPLQPDMTHHTLYLAVVDGDQAASVGMTAEELADFLVLHGVSDALELDGGGSSELFIRGESGVVSSPSDGIERPLANQLGVSYGLSPYRFSVVGLVYDSIFGDMSKLISDATVVVDGQTSTWQNNHTLYHVDNIAPHYVCAHASAPGFRSATQCRLISVADVAPPNGNAIQYLSVVLFPGQDPPPDMAAPPDLSGSSTHGGPPDLSEAPDFGIVEAGQNPNGGPGQAAGGCTLGSEAVPAFPGLLIVVFVGAAVKTKRA